MEDAEVMQDTIFRLLEVYGYEVVTLKTARKGGNDSLVALTQAAMDELKKRFERPSSCRNTLFSSL